eukprot:TRINITY_DN1587_c0_g1_i1.p1 TRINITY_DN1587_c0_g1~~TRINITY_DN1587_c0_g1_i1.p1  ORF type:complete len:429 (-),score=75.00 TRINITY_DN1587_c0_g1_i1:67-1353(-)
MRTRGYVCKTNTPTNTAYRGFGGPQAMMICEQWMDQISHKLEVSPAIVRRKNMYLEGQYSHYGMEMKKTDVTASRCWDEVMEKSDFYNRESLVREFNKKNKYAKRGVYIVPARYGMGFITAKCYNQAGALVNVYTDGSVVVTHGGTEMGQGLHTKMQQIAAQALGCPLDDVYIAETATDKVPNATPTAASVSSDHNGMAVLDACNQLNERLKSVREENPGKSLRELAALAKMEFVDLSAHGYYNRPDIGFDFETGEGVPFSYHVTGAAVSEVEIDCLTGAFTILRSDIVMDVGDSLSPAIDIGQIEGAFVQGMGWSTMEELVYNDKGALLTRGPGTYKIPSFSDIPLNLNVWLLNDAPNPNAIHSSKGIGEPPFFLGASVMFAIQEAVKASREEGGDSSWYGLRSPATCEQIRMAALPSPSSGDTGEL